MNRAGVVPDPGSTGRVQYILRKRRRRRDPQQADLPRGSSCDRKNNLHSSCRWFVCWFQNLYQLAFCFLNVADRLVDITHNEGRLVDDQPVFGVSPEVPVYVPGCFHANRMFAAVAASQILLFRLRHPLTLIRRQMPQVSQNRQTLVAAPTAVL